jgi:hypothetical protein
MIGMARQAWQCPVSDQLAYRLASGRRTYNKRRQIRGSTTEASPTLLCIHSEFPHRGPSTNTKI